MIVVVAVPVKMTFTPESETPLATLEEMVSRSGRMVGVTDTAPDVLVFQFESPVYTAMML